MLIGLPVTVIGAGVAGLAVATALAQRGAQVTVLEQAATITGIGAGLQISPNGAAVLAALGQGDALCASGIIGEAVELRDYKRGATVLRLDLAHRTGPHPFILIHRARLIFLLESAARDAGVGIDLNTRADPAHHTDAPLILGADGLHSHLRTALNGSSGAFFTGQAAWRAVIEDAGAKAEAHVYMGPGRHLVSYPLAGGLRNIVAVEECATWAAEDWAHPDDPDTLRSTFTSFAPTVRAWLDKVESVHLRGIFRHPVAAIWHDEARAILGDAAHPTLPFLAQGANMALEDAWVLADCLSAHPIPQALTLYQSRRHARVTRVIDAATANARNYHLRNPLIRTAAHTALRIGGTLLPKVPLNQFKWLYDHDVTKP